MFVPFETPTGAETYYLNVDNITAVHVSRSQPELCYIKMVDGSSYSIGMSAAAAIAKIAAYEKQ